MKHSACVFILLNLRKRKLCCRKPSFILLHIDKIVLECRYYKCPNICIWIDYTMKEGQYVPPIGLSEVASLPVWIMLHALHLCLLISDRFTYWYSSIFPSLTTPPPPPPSVGRQRNWSFSCSSQVLLLSLTFFMASSGTCFQCNRCCSLFLAKCR